MSVDRESAPESTAPVAVGRAQSVVRRVIVFVILFALVVIAATGVSGLLDRLIGASQVLFADDTELALSLAFALIGAPLAAVLWWWERRRLAADPAERASLVWALYLIAMSFVSLVSATTALAATAAAGIDGEWNPRALSTGLVWSGVWVWHRHMRRSPVTAPTRLADVPVVLGAVYGLAVAAAGAVTAIAVLISQALSALSLLLVSSQHWVVAALQALVWCVIGALVWWWHWFRERAKSATGPFAGVMLVVVAAAAAAVTLFAIGTILFVVLRALFDDDPLTEVLSALDVAIAAGLIGAIVWAYSAHVLAGRSETMRAAGRLVISAIALIGAASGFGVVVNALLATLGDRLVDDDPRTLLLGGLSALVVGAPVWWVAWRPARPVTADEAADPARRVYLVAVFGASAIVAIITLLIIGYRLFEFGLDAGGSAGLVERVRAPLGLLAATAVVFGYHFAIWRRDRALAATIARRQTIGKVVLVSAGDVTALVEAIRAETGAAVSLWSVAPGTPGVVAEDAPAVLGLLTATSAPRVLVIARDSGGVRAIPLAD
ncbi:MAG: DUF5671 domain-containing protein [Microbacterium sp.]